MGAKRTVLIIDDIQQLREAVSTVLEHEGFEVFACGDGASALGAARKNDFQVIIVDYTMPNMNGADVVKHLRARLPSSLIIGVSSDDKEEEFLEAGANAFLQKPYRCDTLIGLIKKKLL